MVVHTHFDRNNTILLNDVTNTGRNPVTELFYGGELGNTNYSRFLFHFDETKLRELYSGGTFTDLTKLTHTLKMTNTGSFDGDLLGKTACGGKQRACSFDLILFSIDQEWDEGVGYDFETCRFIGGAVAKTSICPSNWLESQTNVSWSGGNGVYSGSSSGVTINTQHFEIGNEDIEIDITSAVNAIITGDTNYGFGIAYTRVLEETPTNELQYVGFFTRHTNTFYEPFIESNYNCPIQDDRNNFFLDKANRLYLYTNVGANPTNLDFIPSVKILDSDGELFSSYTSSDVTHVTKGVYCIDVQIPTSSAATDCMIFSDVWSGVTINGVTRSDVELEFVLKDCDGYYNIGSDDATPKKYGFSISGVRRDERIKRGDIRKVFVTAKIPYTVNQSEIIDDLQYRLFVKEGKNEYTVIDYQDVHRTANHNYFLLDTGNLIPNTYYLDVKVTSNLEVSTIKQITSFDIISQSELR
jgi:hypothetical protein